MSSTKIIAIRKSLSAARMGTYECVADNAGNQITPKVALDLYAWNAQVSAALLAPLHICEVVVRNAISEALEAQYGSDWHQSKGFEQSLPRPSVGYNQQKDLQDSRNRLQAAGTLTIGKIIPELKFVFWQKMLTSRHDLRLWNVYLTQIFPNLPSGQSISQSRQLLYEDLELIRKLRNRIAHHEPVFKRNLADDFQKVADLVALRCSVTATWMLQNQQASTLIAIRPV